VLAHVIHDLRPRHEALADRDLVAALATRLGLPFLERTVAVRAHPGNAEAQARRLRYRALADMAREAACPFVATAHHAQDQLETLLMGLLRGSGPRGLSGMNPQRQLGRVPGITLIRPALAVSRTDLQQICSGCGVVWREDATNSDLSRVRAALRHRILPELEKIRPGTAARAARSQALLRDAAHVVDGLVNEVFALGQSGSAPNDSPGLSWPRDHLRSCPAIVIGGLLRSAAAHLSGGHGVDRLGSGKLAAAIRAVRSESGEPRRFELGVAQIVVHAHSVTVTGRHRA
jgi:tRNA(Ile)-lysidine synthetase-like protein